MCLCAALILVREIAGSYAACNILVSYFARSWMVTILWMLQAQDDDSMVEEGCEPTGESVAALKHRTIQLTDQELFSAIQLHREHPKKYVGVCLPDFLHAHTRMSVSLRQTHSHTHTHTQHHRYQMVEQIEDSMSDADDETDDAVDIDEDDDAPRKQIDIAMADDEPIDLLPGGSRMQRARRAIAARRVVADSILQRDAMLKQKRPADAPASAGAFRDSWGRMRPTPEVFTSVRIDVLSAGGVIAPIYDEYLNVLRAKGFVDSWHWPCETELSVQVPH